MISIGLVVVHVVKFTPYDCFHSDISKIQTNFVTSPYVYFTKLTRYLAKQLYYAVG